MNDKHPATTGQRWVLGLTSIAAVMVALDALVVASALSDIRHDLHATVEQLEWTVNAYSLSFAVLLVPAAALGDRIGRRRTFTTGLALFTVSSAACALAGTMPALITARTAQGIGAALMLPLAMALLGAAFPPERRGWAFGIFSGINGLAVLSGPVIGGAVTQGLAWQWIFWINVPLGVAAIPLILRHIPESSGPARRLDPLGAALITLAVLSLVWGAIHGPMTGYFIGGAALLLAFLAWEHHTPQPMVPLTYFRAPAFTAGNTAGFLLTAALFGAVFFNAQYLQTTLGSSPLKAGLQLLPWTASLFIVGPLAGRLVDRVGERPLITTGLTLQAAGLLWLSWLSRNPVTYPALITPLLLAGAGISMAMPAAQSAAIGALPRDAVGIGSGIYSMMRQLGGVAGVTTATALFTAAGGYHTFTTGYSHALTGCATLSLLGALAGLAVPTRRATPPPATQQTAATTPEPAQELR